MHVPRQNPFKKNNQGRSGPALLAWLTSGSPYLVEIAGHAGADAVLIDCQHGIAGKSELIACLTAARAANLPSLVRVRSLDEGAIGEALDAGARGIVCPMINSVEDAKRLVEAVKYPPIGHRSYGPYAGKFSKPDDYFAGANDWTVACAQIETSTALQNLDAIVNVDGITMALAGPNDLAISLSGGVSRSVHNENVVEAVRQIRAGCKAAGVLSALFANDLDCSEKYHGQQWDLLAIGTEASILTATYTRIIQQLNEQ